MQKFFPVATIIMFNLVPIAGVLFYGWVPFEMFWLFWMETLVLTVFNSIRIIFSQGNSREIGVQDAALKLHVAQAIRYLNIRIFIFFFYALFIVVFIGFMTDRGSSAIHVAQTLALQNKLFNIALLFYAMSQVYYLVKYFFMAGTYQFSKPASFASLFSRAADCNPYCRGTGCGRRHISV